MSSNPSSSHSNVFILLYIVVFICFLSGLWFSATFFTQRQIKHIQQEFNQTSELPPAYKMQVSNYGKYRWVDETGYTSTRSCKNRNRAILSAWQWYQYHHEESEQWTTESNEQE